MAWEHYLSFAGQELVNSARAVGYTQTANCPIVSLKPVDDDDLSAALDESQYDFADIAEAPWFDTNMVEVSSQFLGAYVISISGIYDSTAAANVTEGILDGGTVGQPRNAVRQLRVRAALTALSAQGLEYGISWLNNGLRAIGCSFHGTACGSADLMFFASKPYKKAGNETVDEYRDRLLDSERYIHNVSRISGPLVQQQWDRDGQHAAIIEFTLAAGTPFVYSRTKLIDTPLTGFFAYSDVPYNLLHYPSAELSTGTVLVATNYSTNPSVEVNATGWTAAVSTVSGSTVSSYFTSGRSNDVAVDGSWSMRGRVLGNGSTTAAGRAQVDLYNAVTLSPPSGSRVSFSIWGLAAILAGSGTIVSMESFVEWRDAGGALGTDLLGTAVTFAGVVFSGSSLVPPVGTTNLRVYVRAVVDWSSSATPANNSDIRVYADAVLVSVP